MLSLYVGIIFNATYDQDMKCILRFNRLKKIPAEYGNAGIQTETRNNQEIVSNKTVIDIPRNSQCENRCDAG